MGRSTPRDTQEVKSVRVRRGQRAALAGLAAEAQVMRDYERHGFKMAARRWRGQGGEIDLILRSGAALIFVEVKQSRDFAHAAESLRPAQMQRLVAAASEFLAGEPGGQLTEARFDVALVNGRGEVRILENAFGTV
ncbi:putative endonuclease [Salinihabitans flavidus]|uniref:UPF0102 protein SAMN04490248_10188 n=1 Tax=Salinihabitans flavidus TaxID=569882 RepID=A0A1H8LCZ8_9RHOB|nr:YraN family protein [Salinihabitans flavidus]SEO02943.1 putative endonuclease [Salinihabitans flavidus]